ncbi:YheC/YheD family protein [Bacillus sp. DTU_2020_1000418_1_SI_GHA_SEK_038]|uniref:YheC/YheD family endospore coat-associated protein n=1 Tax=Bacillus sp. DTU_2020_1000418_1_SI_GHA_SEK_038 TaxID=3077585 RepID=UPI0028E44031|nr:YheC/YheD family protein [Bacillus sp. DTU_2020_1000418_1_SI_GHA_SEK_038]WNS76744.1 YheC/YheD family protein [Bacillus sp. DTU_2020_1000418_1_SI_GHA_SEK_038]
MLSFGLMTLQTSNEKHYFNEIAKRAHELEMACYRFVPSNINPISEKVSGDYFNPDTNEWEACEFPLPKVLYDRCFYKEDPHSKRCKAIVKWLKTKKDILFLGYGLPNKLELYDALENSKLSPYLLKSSQVKSGQHVIQHLFPNKPLMMKPVNGSQGRGIYYLEKKNNEFIIQTDKQNKTITRLFPYEEKVISLIDYLIKERGYLIQEYKKLTNNMNQPFDIRVLLQKNGNGVWQEIAKGIRTGKEKGIISNINAGGLISSYEDWLASHPSSERDYVNNEINEVLRSLPQILEQHFPPLFELGVDIGVSENFAIWILDINSKPGRKVALTINPSLEDHLYTSPLIYGKRLDLERRQIDEKTISGGNSS